MSALTIRSFRPALSLVAQSQHIYRLVEPATPYHKHVWLALSERDGSHVIVKTPLRDHDDEQRKVLRQLNTEIEILDGPLKGADGVRQLVDQIILTDEPAGQVRAGVFEYLDFDLHQYHLTLKRGFSRFQIKSLTRQILKALSATHRNNIVHTDLKPDNIVFSFTKSPNSDLIAKLIDFGVASQSDEDRHRKITNSYWRSPESWLGIPWGPPTDVWSLGAIVGSLLMEPGAKLLRPMGGLSHIPPDERDRESIRSLWTLIPFEDDFVHQVPWKWQEEIARFTPKLAATGTPITLSFVGDIFGVPDEDWSFVSDILQIDPEKRPTADKLLRHPWLNS